MSQSVLIDKDQLRQMSEADLRLLLWKATWLKKRLPHQIEPDGDWWTIWLLMAGRGAGKTRTAAEWLGQRAATYLGTRWLTSAATHSDVRDTCYEGESGLLAVIPKELLIDNGEGEGYSKTLMELRFKNGSLIKGIGAEDPNRFRGPQFHGGWLDELAAWQYGQDSLDMIMFGMRLGLHPQLVVSTTPKPREHIRALVNRKGIDVAISYGSSYANRANLAPTFFHQIQQYEGTLLGRQEIHGELIDAEEQGVIKRSWIPLWPHDKPLPAFEFIVVSFDTAMTEQTMDTKSGEQDYTACTIWGLFKHPKNYSDSTDRRTIDSILLLDCWQERIGVPEILDRIPKIMDTAYGERSKSVIRPGIGSAYLDVMKGKKPDLLIIEDKGSGIASRQLLYREGIYAHAYNPGRADKLQRLHAVSHYFSNGMVYIVESSKYPGRPISWADPPLSPHMPPGLVTQLCSYTGKGSLKHDDFVDSTTQALRVIGDKKWLSIAKPRAVVNTEMQVARPRVINPYAV
jgi:phage terminase large subunit-like protein